MCLNNLILSDAVFTKKRNWRYIDVFNTIIQFNTKQKTYFS